MSIIAEALKKAQRKGKSGGGTPAPFKLGQKKESAPAAQAGKAPRARPVVVKPGTAAPRAKPKATAQPASAAPKATTKATAKTKSRATGRLALLKKRKVRLALMVAVFLVVSSAALYYVNFIYLPGLEGGGISAPVASSPPPPPQVQEPESAEPVADTGDEAAVEVTDAGAETARNNEDIQAESGAEEIRVPPVPGSETDGGEQGSDVAQASVAFLPDLIQDGQDQELPAITAVEGESRDIAVPSVPPPQNDPGTIVHKGEQEKQLREDIYHFNMAVYFQRKGEVREALREYQEVIRLSPHNAEVFSNMGALYNQVGEYEEAVSSLQKALLIDPRYSKARNNLAVAYYRMGQYEPALEQAKMAIELQPGNLNALNNMGLIYRKTNRFDMAEQSFSRALAVDSGYAAAHYNLALLYEQSGQLNLAARHYRSYLSSGGGSEQFNSKVRSRLQDLSTTVTAPGN